MPPRLDLSLHQRGETAIVRLVGELDRVTAPELTAVLERG
jgi:anti-anti-sigma regulatory factor